MTELMRPSPNDRPKNAKLEPTNPQMQRCRCSRSTEASHGAARTAAFQKIKEHIPAQ